jgi:hypothetical protein
MLVSRQNKTRDTLSLVYLYTGLVKCLLPFHVVTCLLCQLIIHDDLVRWIRVSDN